MTTEELLIYCPIDGCERGEPGRGFSRPNGLSRHLRQSHPLHAEPGAASPEPEPEPEPELEAELEAEVAGVIEVTLDDEELEVLDAIAFLRDLTPYDVLTELITRAIAHAADDDVAQLIVLRRRYAA